MTVVPGESQQCLRTHTHRQEQLNRLQSVVRTDDRSHTAPVEAKCQLWHNHTWHCHWDSSVGPVSDYVKAEILALHFYKCSYNWYIVAYIRHYTVRGFGSSSRYLMIKSYIVHTGWWKKQKKTGKLIVIKYIYFGKKSSYIIRGWQRKTIKTINPSVA